MIYAKHLMTVKKLERSFVIFLGRSIEYGIEVFLYKLNSIGKRGKLLNWMSSYLSNKQQRVFLNSSASEWSTITAGVPQGSILGPLLFLLYIKRYRYRYTI